MTGFLRRQNQGNGCASGSPWEKSKQGLVGLDVHLAILQIPARGGAQAFTLAAPQLPRKILCL